MELPKCNKDITVKIVSIQLYNNSTSYTLDLTIFSVPTDSGVGHVGVELTINTRVSNLQRFTLYFCNMLSWFNKISHLQ